MALFGIGSGERPKFKLEEGLRPGFREMKWGDLPKKEMTVLDQNGDDRYCLLPADDLTFGGKPVERIVYKYFQARLSDVVLELPADSADGVFEYLEKTWGKASRPNKFIDDFFWQNKSHGVEATVASFSRNPSTRIAVLTIQSAYIKAKRNIAQGKEPGKL